MDDLADKRVFGDRAGATRLVVAASPGLVVIAVSDGRVGEYGLARRCAPTAVAAVPDGPADGGPRLAVATDEDVLAAPDIDVAALESVSFGSAVAVTFDRGRLVAASPAGRLAIYDGDGAWTTVAELSAPPTALEGDLVGTAEGVRRLDDTELRPAGLVDVADVARAGGIPLAATSEGVYALGNGWLDVVAGDFRLVAGAPDGRAHAATASTFFERVDGEWRAVDRPGPDPVVAVAYGERTYAFTAGGDLLVGGADGWTVHPLGLDGVRAAIAR